jgi:hypothetical protein
MTNGSPEVDISDLLARARTFPISNRGRRTYRPGEKISINDYPITANSPTLKTLVEETMTKTGDSRENVEDYVMRAQNLGNPADILTPKELAERLKVPEGWIFEKTRARCDNPIPCLHMGRFIRFDWPSVVGWLESEAVSKGNGISSPAKTSRKRN